MKSIHSLAMLIACLSTTSLNVNTASAKININPIDIVFTDDVIGSCQLKGPHFYDLYFSGFDVDRRKLVDDVLYIDNSSRYNMDPQYTTGIPVVKFAGIKAISEIQHNTRDKIENVMVMDIDVVKHDMHILRFANFSGRYYVYDNGKFTNDYEGSGFYYIVKGTPEINTPKITALSKNGLSDNMRIEKTEANNTRVICGW